MDKLFYLLILSFLGITCQNSGPLTIPCDFGNSLSNTTDIVCGEMTVPENHDNPDGRKIQVAYVILKAKSDASHEYPLIYLSGGPGGAQLFAANIENWLAHPVRDKRDIILIDQRGIGLSSALPSIETEYYEIMAANATPDQEQIMVNELLTTYKNKCREKGIQLEHYNTFQNARDVGLLMQHLGYERYNLYCVSYGTRLGRVVQDMYPNYLNAVIFNSPNPFGGDMLIDRLKSYSLALQRLFDYCENDNDCRATYPDLKKDYLDAIAFIEKNPLKIESNGNDFYINAQDALYLLRRRLYAPDSKTAIPALIQEFLNGGGPVIKEIIEGELNATSTFNFSMWLSVERHEFYHPEYTEAYINEVYESLPLLPARMGYFSAIYQALRHWHNASLPEEKKAFQPSSIPTMITVNQYDPVTPPENGYIFKSKLSNAHLFILDEGGHGGGNEACRNKVLIAFMDNPESNLDSSCLNLYKE